MKTWIGLIKKEFKLTQSFVLAGLLLLAAVSFFNVYLAYHSSPGTSILSSIVVFTHVFYLVIYILVSIFLEWKHTAQLWLQHPQPGWMLLAVKLINGFLAMLVSIFVASAFCYWAAGIDLMNSKFFTSQYIEAVQWDAVLQLSFLLILVLIFFSLYLGFWALALSLISLSLKRYLKRGSWLAGVLIITACSWVINAFQNTALYDNVTHWGLVQIKLKNIVLLNDMPPELQSLQLPLYFGEFSFYLAVMILLFLLSSWLLDSKVEV